MLIHSNKTLTATQFDNLIDLTEDKIQEVLNTVTEQLVGRGNEKKHGGADVNGSGN
jgi:hypothetical protein